MTVTITKTVDIKTLPLEDLQSMPQLELAELLFKIVHEEHDPKKELHPVTSKAANIIHKLIESTDLSEEDFISFGYVPDSNHLESKKFQSGLIALLDDNSTKGEDYIPKTNIKDLPFDPLHNSKENRWKK